MSEAAGEGIRCMWMRGGTSKGGYFLASDLPADTAARDAFLLSMMGSPDSRQIAYVYRNNLYVEPVAGGAPACEGIAVCE